MLCHLTKNTPPKKIITWIRTTTQIKPTPSMPQTYYMGENGKLCANQKNCTFILSWIFYRFAQTHPKNRHHLFGNFVVGGVPPTLPIQLEINVSLPAYLKVKSETIIIIMIIITLYSHILVSSDWIKRNGKVFPPRTIFIHSWVLYIYFFCFVMRRKKKFFFRCRWMKIESWWFDLQNCNNMH